MTDLARLGIEVDTSQITQADKKLDQLGGSAGVAAKKTKRATDGMSSGYSNAGKAIALAKAALVSFIAVTATAVMAIRRFISGTSEAEAAQAQLASAIISTGGAANRSQGQLNAFAAELQSVTNFGDEAINAMQGVLLTFTQIEGATFDRATSAILDLSTAMGTDLKSSALQVGKALNDPILGMTALSRSGIQFTEAQKDTVAAMVEMNDVAGAQAIILKELETQFGGSAAAARDTLGGALTSLGNAWGDLFELTGPATQSLKVAVEGLITAISDPRFVGAVSAIGTALFGMLEVGIKAMTGLSSGVAFLAENIDSVSGIAIAAAAALTVSFTPAIVAATVATGAWVISLFALQAALIATGIGAVVVGVGLLIGKLISARRHTENWGDAFKMIALQVKAASLNMKAWFQGALFDMAQAFQDFTWTLATAMNGLFGGDMQGVVIESITSGALGNSPLEQSIKRTETAANAAAAAANGLRVELGSVGDEGENAAGSIADVNEALAGTSGSGGTAGAASAAADAVADFDSTMSDAVMTMEEMGVSKAQVLIGGIDSVSNAFGDWTARGFKDFKGFATSIIGTFQGMLAQMIAMAAKNKILLSLGFGASAAPAAASAATSGLTGAAGLGSSLVGGASSVISGLFSGGLSGGASALTTALGGATTGIAGMATAIGAAALPVAAVVAAFSFFSTKTKKLDSGLRLTAEGMNLAIDSFEKVKKTRFFGLSSSTSTSSSAADSSTADPISQAFGAMTNAVSKSAAVLGISSKAFAGFSAELNLSLEGLTDEQAQAAVIQGLTDMGNQFASMAGNLSDLARDGEDAMTTLARLGSELQTVNGVMDTLGLQTYDLSLAGAAAVSGLADMYGGIQQLTAATNAYYAAFYTNEEQLANTTASLTAAFAELGVAMPETRAGLRSLVDGTGDAILAAEAKLAGLENFTITGPVSMDEATALYEAQAKQRSAVRGTIVEQELLQSGLISLASTFDQMVSASEALANQTVTGTAAATAAEEAQRLLAESVARAARDAANLAADIASERLGIQRKIWELQGNEDALRSNTLSTLYSSNQGLQERLWRLQDEAEATEAATQAIEDLVQSLSPENFANALDYNLALGRASQGIAGTTATGVPLSVVPNSSAANAPLIEEIQKLKAELVDFKEESRGLTMNGNSDIRKIRRNSDRDQAIGTPAVRTS